MKKYIVSKKTGKVLLAIDLPTNNPHAWHEALTRNNFDEETIIIHRELFSDTAFVPEPGIFSRMWNSIKNSDFWT